jgi:hypothetical protein
VRLLGWCWEHRSFADYGTIFTEDYRFAFSVSDSCASAFPAGFTRDDELVAARRIFVTGASGLPPAKQIRLVFLDDLFALDDSRPGKTPMVHKEILTRVDLSLDFSDGSGSRSLESVRFFLARGDSAEVPQEFRAGAPSADTSRWYVERWEEEAPVVTSQISGGARLGPATALPTRPISWGYLKWVYLARPAAPSARKQ